MSDALGLDFEISFFEGILAHTPGFIEAWIALGDAYTKKGRYEDGLQVDSKLARMRPDDGVIRYNLACSYSLLGKADACLQALADAIRLGYRDFAFMFADADLAFIRKDPRFHELLSIIHGNSGE